MGQKTRNEVGQGRLGYFDEVSGFFPDGSLDDDGTFHADEEAFSTGFRDLETGATPRDTDGKLGDIAEFLKREQMKRSLKLTPAAEALLAKVSQKGKQ